MTLNNKKNKGYSILELLFYSAFFSVLSLVVINSMIIMTRSFRETSIQSELSQSGVIMERISREIRQASNVSSINSDDLVLNTGTNKTMEFKFINSDIQLWDTGVNIGNLNSPKIAVDNLVFTQITTTKGQAVKILLTVRSVDDALGRTVDFYDTIVLRNSY